MVTETLGTVFFYKANEMKACGFRPPSCYSYTTDRISTGCGSGVLTKDWRMIFVSFMLAQYRCGQLREVCG